MTYRRVVVVVFALAGLLAAGLPISNVGAATPGSWAPSSFGPERTHRKLDPQLESRSPSRGSLMASSAQSETSDRVVAQVEGQSMSDVEAAIADVQGEIRTRTDGLRLAWIPRQNLGALAEDARVSAVRAPRSPTPVAFSEGVALTGAKVWQGQGYDGTGVKVGVVDVGFAGLVGEQNAGRLPPSVGTQSYCGNGMDGTSDLPQHGTAVAEIIHEMAPNAQLYLVCIQFDVDLQNAETWLASQGVSIVNASIGDFFGARGDGSGPMGQAVTAGRNAGQLWSVASGNFADRHYNFTAVDNDGDGAVEFAGGPLSVNSPDPGELYYFNLPSNGTVNLGIKYDAWPTTNQEFAVCLWNANAGPPFFDPIQCQSGQQHLSAAPPLTGLFMSGLAGGTYLIAIFRVANTSITPRFDMYFGGDESALQRVAPSGSLSEPATSPSAMAVGAYNWRDTGSVEPYSGQGPTIDGRRKPDISGPDGTDSFFFGPFFGTSASTPHVTGAAALLKQGTPTFTPAQLQTALQNRSVDAGVAGADNQFGVGRLSLQLMADGGPAAVTVNGQEIVFMRGTDGAVWQRFANGTWVNLGGFTSADPAATAMPNGRVDLFVRGREGAMYQKTSTNGGVTFGPWASLGGFMIGAPGAASWGQSRIDLFVRGGDNQLWHRPFVSFWGSWEFLGGTMTSAPAISTWAPNRLDIFVKGGNNGLWHKWWAGGWSGWENLGGGMTSGPGAVSPPGTTTIDVFARGGDGQMWTRRWNGSSWPAWTQANLTGQKLQGDPDPTSPSSTVVDTYMIGADANLWRKTRTNGTWGAWTSLGPPPSTPPGPPPP